MNVHTYYVSRTFKNTLNTSKTNWIHAQEEIKASTERTVKYLRNLVSLENCRGLSKKACELLNHYRAESYLPPLMRSWVQLQRLPSHPTSDACSPKCESAPCTRRTLIAGTGAGGAAYAGVASACDVVDISRREEAGKTSGDLWGRE